MSIRRRLCLVLWVVLAACQPVPAPPSKSSADTVLMLGGAQYPVMKEAVAEIQARNERLRGVAPALGVEFHDVELDRDTDGVVRQLLPHIERYRYVFSNGQTVARTTQLLVPDRPIVFDGIDDPVANCLVDTLARPGRNATGYMHLLHDTESKMLELLHDGFPSMRRVLVLVSGLNTPPLPCDQSALPPIDPPCHTGLHDVDAQVLPLIEADRIAATARRFDVAVQFLVMCRPEDFALVRHVVASGPAGAVGATGLLVPWHSLFDDEIEGLLAVLNPLNLPVVYPDSRFVEGGGLMSIEPILDLGKDRASVLALMQVIDGRDPATLPVQGPRGFEITLNPGAAARQGLRPSRLLMRRADRILQ